MYWIWIECNFHRICLYENNLWKIKRTFGITYCVSVSFKNRYWTGNLLYLWLLLFLFTLLMSWLCWLIWLDNNCHWRKIKLLCFIYFMKNLIFCSYFCFVYFDSQNIMVMTQNLLLLLQSLLWNSIKKPSVPFNVHS